MELYSLDRNFHKQEIIDEFISAVWNERYRGDGDFQLVVPATDFMKSTLQKGQLMMCVDSPEPMILETRDIDAGILKTTGITLTQWLNNRTIRTSADHAQKDWHMYGFPPGEVLKIIVQQMCISGDYLDGTVDIGIPSADTALFSIPGLVIGVYDTDGDDVDMLVPFGPVYDALKDISDTYEVGMNILLDFVTEASYQISFNTYRGVDRTSDQDINPIIRFSPEMDSFDNITDLESITEHRNFIYTFAPQAPSALITDAGFASSFPGTPEAGFDLRVFQGFADDIVEDQLGGSSATLINLLNQKAKSEMQNRKIVQLVDGEVVQTPEIKYGVDFFMGDIVEVEGNTGILQHARITEHIRSEDENGEKNYPTLSMID